MCSYNQRNLAYSTVLITLKPSKKAIMLFVIYCLRKVLMLKFCKYFSRYSYSYIPCAYNKKVVLLRQR